MSELESYNILVISDLTVEHFLDIELKNVFLENNVQVNVTYTQYNVFKEEVQSKEVNFDYIILWLNLAEFNSLDIYDKDKEEAIFYELSTFYHELKQLISVPIMWIGIDSYEDDMSFVEGNIISKYNIKRNLNTRLCKAIERRDVIIDLEKIIAYVGIASSYNLKYKYTWGCIYDKKVFNLLAKEIYKQYKILRNITPKCVVLDCDNVLWGGILSESGKDNIKLGNLGVGRLYKDFQRMILTLYNHGIILTIASKNDLSDVKYIFQNHSEMILKEEHIACFEVNWGNKADSINKIAKTLNISLDSMVFIDDSILEINLINFTLPMVKTILFEKFKILNDLNCFHVSCDYDFNNIKLRNETYKSNIMREQLQIHSKSFKEYLESLEMNIEIKVAEPIDFNRISELSLRTNKGTNGKRYTLEELKTMASNTSYSLYKVSVSDRFSNLGIVGAIGIIGSKDSDVLDLFCLSCRAFGYKIEDAMINEIASKYNICNIVKYSTQKNSDFIDKLSSMLCDSSSISDEEA